MSPAPTSVSPAIPAPRAEPSTPAASANPSPGSSPRRLRLASLDVVRGIAVCGILFANVATIIGVMVPWSQGKPPLSYTLEHLLIQERFFPIFSLLFGVGFGMIWRSASSRAAHPRLVLLRRLLSLGVLGVLHQLLQPGEALLGYAIAGILLLLPATFLPERARPWISLGLGAVLLLGAVPAGGILLIPGLFLLGFAAALMDLPRRFEASAAPGLLLALVGGGIAISFTVMQLQNPQNAGFSTESSAAGLAAGLCLVGLIGAALRTPLRTALIAAFSPLGRMALTNYVGATVVGVLIGLVTYRPAVLHGDAVSTSEGEMFTIWGCCVLLLIAQSLLSRWWLVRFGQGPLEKAWRWVTWAGARPRAGVDA